MNKRTLLNCKAPDLNERSRRFDQSYTPASGADDNLAPPAQPPLPGTTIGKSNKSWQNLFSFNTMVMNQKLQLAFVDTAVPGTQQFGCLYFIRDSPQAVFKWDGSSYAAYTPVDGQCWFSVSSNVSFRKRMYVYASGTLYKTTLT